MIVSKKDYDALRKELSNLMAKKGRLEYEKEQVERNNIILIERNRELQRKLDAITVLVTSNTYNNEAVIFAKIKELVRPGNQN